MNASATRAGKLKAVFFTVIAIGVLGGVGYYLFTVYQADGLNKFIYSVVLIAALIIGVAHLVLYVLRRMLESQKTEEAKRKKRRLELIRNTINYFTPFVLIAMLYHFWQRDLVLASIIVVVLLMDRINDLLKKNK